MRLFTFIFLVFCITESFAQTGPGIGIYATGSEVGLGLRSAKETRWLLDARITKANIYSEKTKASTFATELSAVCRVVKLEKVRFHIGIGYKAEWNLNDRNRHGLVIPVGVEAFPFPFHYAGLFFEAGLFALSDPEQHYYSGIRTAAGIVFYFPKKTITPEIKP